MKKSSYLPRHELLQQNLALRIVVGHARSGRRSGGCRDLLWGCGAHRRHGRRRTRLGAKRQRGPSEQSQKCGLALIALDVGPRHVRRNRTSVSGRWGGGAGRVGLLLRAVIDIHARNAGLRAYVGIYRRRGVAETVEERIEVGLRGVRLGSLANRGGRRAMGLG